MATRKQAAADSKLLVNRAPVLTLWGAVVAERLGFDRDEALTLGRALAGLNAQSKGRALGLFQPASPAETRRRREAARAGERLHVELMGRAIPAVHTSKGLRALDSSGKPSEPAPVERYLAAKFGESLTAVRSALHALAAAFAPAELAGRAFSLYEHFRPAVPAGTRGWGAKGELDLGTIRALAASPHRSAAARARGGGSS